MICRIVSLYGRPLKPLFARSPSLHQLHADVLTYLKSLMCEASKDALTPFFSKIPDSLKTLYASVFRNPKTCGQLLAGILARQNRAQ
ncbi:Uncharacterised protein [Klebsiella michiganensis]|uniref:Uncharacterized protein n=1 Tax=Klebsiella michiganensis TaxID=1134687 RepID=A0A7H4PQC6_9ENTR|nr:Uncharacterised protein [Klebsiella michiganensis]